MEASVAIEPPEPKLIRSFEDAESATAEWLRFYGYVDVVVVGGAGDGGVDVRGIDILAQVKAEVGKVGRPVVQQTYGISRLESKRAAVFSLGGFTEEAIAWANDAEVGLFTFDLVGEPQPLNAAARDMAINAGSDERRIRLRECLGQLEKVLPEIESAAVEVRQADRAVSEARKAMREEMQSSVDTLLKGLLGVAKARAACNPSSGDAGASEGSGRGSGPLRAPAQAAHRVRSGPRE